MLDRIIKKDSERYPDFLSSNITHHIEAMSCIWDIFRAIRQINIPTFLDDSNLANVAMFIHSKFMFIKDLLEYTTYMKCLDYFRFKLYLYVDYNLKEENYEEVHNMQQIAFHIFSKKFKHIIHEEDEDEYDF